MEPRNNFQLELLTKHPKKRMMSQKRIHHHLKRRRKNLMKSTMRRSTMMKLLLTQKELKMINSLKIKRELELIAFLQLTVQLAVTPRSSLEVAHSHNTRMSTQSQNVGSETLLLEVPTFHAQLERQSPTRRKVLAKQELYCVSNARTHQQSEVKIQILQTLPLLSLSMVHSRMFAITLSIGTINL